MKIQTDTLSSWADAHVFYGMYEYNIGEKKAKITKEEYEWRNEFLTGTPNGSLLLKNSFFDDLRTKDRVYLAHVTPNFHNIRENHILYPSAGCLVGSIYCTPLSKIDGKLRMHNLGEFIFNREMPLFAKFTDKERREPLEILVFEVELPETSKNNLVGVDYLRLGDIHFNTHKDLEYLLSPDERFELQEICVNRIRRAFNYLCTCNRICHSNTKMDDVEFLKMFIEAINSLPILGYFYFEALAEYIMLYQDNEEARKFSSLGEYYSPSYKEMVFYLCPHLSKNFSLREFKPTLEEVAGYINKKGIINNFDRNKMLRYLAKRLAFLTNARLFSRDAKLMNWECLRWDFEELSREMKPLLGHLIHRELRTFGRYPYFYFYYDQYKALEIWNYWNHMNIAIPFNGIIPKGEVGINPAHPNLCYRTYSTKVIRENGYMYLDLKKELELEIVPKLVDPKFISMRNKYEDNRKPNWIS
ncbi:hypothetical protein C4578_02430 [Candidatus Microgenomates bacterium]|jgi:hypothetical protein|nr:MAG: hypothetical protein C4578_02430 [Candidatus Microgenomates bacterium]